MPTITISTIPHRVCDLKTEFTVRQARKVFSILKQLSGVTESLAAFAQNGIPWDAVPALVAQIEQTLGTDALLELFCVFFIPVGETYDESRIPERKQLMLDAPIGALVEAMKSFFPSRTAAAASSSGSLQAAEHPAARN